MTASDAQAGRPVNANMKNNMNTIGVDIIEIDRIREAVLRWQDSFLRRIYTDIELGDCRDRFPSLAARFAAKEAVMKSLRSGATGIAWRDIEILRDENGAPCVRLHGTAQDKAGVLGLSGFAVSLSHCEKYAIATSVANAA
jgi:holo-[acyl-carrier protein] synthase